MIDDFVRREFFARSGMSTTRHAVSFIEAGPQQGPLMIFVHGWPELGILWRRQLEYFAGLGWHCVAPDMRGYGGSSIPSDPNAYTMREIVADMTGLFASLNKPPAVWIGHDWGSPVAGSIAAQHPAICRGVVLISVPYFPDGFALASLVPLVDRTLYPAETYPDGQWDYFHFYQESFDQAARDYEADVEATMASIFRPGNPDAIGKPAPTATVRANGGRYGAAHRAPSAARDRSMMPDEDFRVLVESFRCGGFRGPDAWYVNDAANIAYAGQAPDRGRLSQPVLFLNGRWDVICDVTRSHLGEPMRAACPDLTVEDIPGGHWLMLERPDDVNQAIARWLVAENLSAST
jgi:pimeloyl-ACP methyl ester carboxylesterase